MQDEQLDKRFVDRMRANDRRCAFNVCRSSWEKIIPETKERAQCISEAYCKMAVQHRKGCLVRQVQRPQLPNFCKDLVDSR